MVLQRTCALIALVIWTSIAFATVEVKISPDGDSKEKVEAGMVKTFAAIVNSSAGQTVSDIEIWYVDSKGTKTGPTSGATSIDVPKDNFGIFTIYAQAKVDGATYAATPVKYTLVSLKVNKGTVYLCKDEESDIITATLEPKAGGDTGTITVSDDTVVSVTPGSLYLSGGGGDTFKIKGLKAGKATVTVTEDQDPNCTVEISVTVFEVTLTPDPVVVVSGKTGTATATIEPASEASLINFDVDDTSIVDVSPKTGTGGTQTLTLTSVDGKFGETALNAKCPGGDICTSVKVNVVKLTVEINGTPQKSDDITLINPPTPIRATITLFGASANVALSVAAPDNASLSSLSLSLSDGVPQDVNVNPLKRSAAPNDVTVTATYNSVSSSETLTIANVEIPETIRGTHTPTGFPDRIPPRIDHPAHIVVEPDLGSSGQFVTVDISKVPLAGVVTINRRDSLDLTTTTDVNLHSNPTDQTQPGNAGLLRMRAKLRGVTMLISNPFSVSSIPIDFTQASVEKLNFGALRFIYKWKSDSGQLSDLDQVWVGEYVTYSDGGVHVGANRPWKGNNPHPTIAPARSTKNGTSGAARDTHIIPGTETPDAGPADTYTATQNYGFRDFRCQEGADDGTLGWQTDLAGKLTINRYVEIAFISFPLTWGYRITKSGVEHTYDLPKKNHKLPKKY